MDNEIFFSEQQRFKQWWLWLILLGTNGLILYGVFQQVINGKPFGNNPMNNTGLLLLAGLLLLLTLLFINFRLDTVIKNDGIYVRFFPFHIKFKYYTWSSLRKAFIRPYDAITEYGGWGLRFGSNGMTFNVSGNKGLQLEFTNNKKLLIGTNKPDQLTDTLSKIGQLKS